jgi:hypothetical protein
MKRKASFGRFLGHERGAVLVEFLLFIPLLVWTMIAAVVFWDVFRTINTSQKAVYSVSDLISRQEDNLPTAFVNGMQDVFDFLMVNSAQNVQLRITSLYYDLDDDKYRLIFSVSPDNKLTGYTEDELEALKDRVPVLNDGDSVIIVESMIDYTPPFDTGIFNLTDALSSQAFTHFVVTPPRFRTAICLETPGCPVGI